jgi:hypothetical protein
MSLVNRDGRHVSLPHSVLDGHGTAVSVTIDARPTAGGRHRRSRRVSKVRIQLVPGVVPASQASSASRVVVTPDSRPGSPRRRAAGAAAGNQ